MNDSSEKLQTDTSIENTGTKRKLSELEDHIDDIEVQNESRVFQISKKKATNTVQAIKCFCRIRPVDFKNEIFKIKEDDDTYLTINADPNLLKKLSNGIGISSFTFSKVFGENSTQAEVFERTCMSLLDDLLIKRKSGLIFTYGMTNAGKTFTVVGSPTNPGILPLSLSYLSSNVEKNPRIKIYSNFVEIYNEEVFDLLANPPNPKDKQYKKKLAIKENTKKLFFLPGATMTPINSIEDFNNVLNKGIQRKSHAHTNLNSNSSRSHTIFKIILKDETEEDDINLSIVDLAGSERATRTETQGKELVEACKINNSLSVLGKCMEALRCNSIYTNKRMVPFRESKLTMLFQEYFQGDQNVIMITNINPRKEDFEETMRALAYSCIAKEIKPIKSKIVVNPVKKQVKIMPEGNEDAFANINNMNKMAMMNMNIQNAQNNFNQTQNNMELKNEIDKLREELFLLKSGYFNNPMYANQSNQNQPYSDTKDLTLDRDLVSKEEDKKNADNRSVIIASSPRSVDSDEINMNPTSTFNLRNYNKYSNKFSNSNMGNIATNLFNPFQALNPYEMLKQNPFAILPYMNPYTSFIPQLGTMNQFNQLNPFSNIIPNSYPQQAKPVDLDLSQPNNNMGSFNLVLINPQFNDLCMGPKKKLPRARKKKEDGQISPLDNLSTSLCTEMEIIEPRIISKAIQPIDGIDEEYFNEEKELEDSIDMEENIEDKTEEKKKKKRKNKNNEEGDEEKPKKRRKKKNEDDDNKEEKPKRKNKKKKLPEIEPEIKLDEEENNKLSNFLNDSVETVEENQEINGTKNETITNSQNFTDKTQDKESEFDLELTHFATIFEVENDSD